MPVKNNQKQSNIPTPVEFKIIELIIQDPTITRTEIAKKLKINRNRVNDILSRDDIKEQIKDLQMSALQLFQEQQAKAVKGLAKLMDSDNEYIRLSAYKEFVKSLQTIKVDSNVNMNIPVINISFE